jgi:hypothetical protein
MKRRDFIKHTAAGAFAVAVGCRTRPSVRDGARRRLGPAGPLVGILGFGSHTTPELLARRGERESHLRYALEHGVNFFDLYPNPRGGPSTYTAGMAEVRANVAAARRPGLRADEAGLLSRLSAVAGNRCRYPAFDV